MQVRPQLRLPEREDVAEILATFGPASLIYLAKNVVYAMVSVRRLFYCKTGTPAHLNFLLKL